MACAMIPAIYQGSISKCFPRTFCHPYMERGKGIVISVSVHVEARIVHIRSTFNMRKLAMVIVGGKIPVCEHDWPWST
jgi:hypothetical protein